MPKFGLGKGLGSLIPTRIQKEVLPKSSPAALGLDDRIIQAEVEKISPNPHQPRKNFTHSELEDLTNSIKEHGIIQPLILTRTGDKYQLIAGERRLRAAKILGLKTVPSIIRKAEKQEQLELALLENIQRSNLNPIEEAYAYERLMNEFNLTQDDLSKRIGKSRPVITNTLRLLQLPEAIQKALIDGKINYSAARVMAGLPQKDQMKFFEKAVRNELTVRSLEGAAQRTQAKKRARQAKDPNILFLEEKLQEFLGTRVHIKKTTSGGEVVVHFYSEDELNEIVRKLGLR